MAAISGTTGNVTFATGHVVFVHKWQIDIAGEALDTSIFSGGSAWKTNIDGLKGATGSYTCYMGDTTAPPITMGATAAAFTLTAAAGKTYTGSLIVNGVQAGVSKDGSERVLVVQFTVSSTLTGA